MKLKLSAGVLLLGCVFAPLSLFAHFALGGDMRVASLDRGA